MDVTKVRCDECGDLKPVHKQQTMLRRMKARSVWSKPASTYIWTCCYDCWTAQSHVTDVGMLRIMAFRLCQRAKAWTIPPERGEDQRSGRRLRADGRRTGQRQICESRTRGKLKRNDQEG